MDESNVTADLFANMYSKYSYLAGYEAHREYPDVLFR